MEVPLREKGRITIPAKVRKALGLREGDRLQLKTEGGAIILAPKRVVTSKQIKGIIGPLEVQIEELEDAFARDLS